MNITTQNCRVIAASVALLASTVFVAAQGSQKQGAEPGGPGQIQREQGSQPGRQQGQKEQQPSRQQGQKEQGKGTTGQGPREQPSKQGQSKEKGKSEPQREQGAQKDQGRKDQGKGQTTGQGQPKEGQSKPGQSKDAQPGQRQVEPKGRDRNETQGVGREGGSGSVTLTTEQRTRVRETMISRGPRVTSVNFSVNVGTVVPTSVRVVQVDPVLIEYYPRFRGMFYFVYRDEIIIVDRNHRIVAVIEV